MVACAVQAGFPRYSRVTAVERGDPEYEKFDGCGMNGSITDSRNPQFKLSILKNRYWLPPSTPTISFGKMLSTQSGSPSLSTDSGVSLVCYVAEAHAGGVEIWNCNLTSEQDRDYYFTVVPTAADVGRERKGDHSRVLVAEMSPRIKQLAAVIGYPWNSIKALSSLVGKKVRLEGWLLDDFVHRKDSLIDGGNRKKIQRGSCWEVHPITAIHVLD